MRAGVVTPVATLNPRFFQSWEAEAGIEAIAAVATTAERLGYHHVTCSEHVAIAADKVPVRGASYWDPLATLGYLAALTSRIRLATHVLVLPFHHPLEIAKRYGTLDRISRGRLILGIGTGSAPEEFELLGVPYTGRGSMVDDAIKAVRQSFARQRPAYHGTHYSFDGWVVQPHGVQERVPIWVGGRSERSLRRAVELGDGWAPQGARHDALADMIRRARDTDAFGRASRPSGPGDGDVTEARPGRGRRPPGREHRRAGGAGRHHHQRAHGAPFAPALPGAVRGLRHRGHFDRIGQLHATGGASVCRVGPRSARIRSSTFSTHSPL